MGKRTVLAFGSFDIMHPGHLHYLSKAKSMGDRLIVVVARDASIRMLKKKEPAMDERSRLKMVAELKMVDKAVLGRKLAKPSDRYAIIKRYRPSVIVFGYDQKVNDDDVMAWLIKNRIDAKIVRINSALGAHVHKSSKLLKLLKEA